jgi:outer membrane autotransporter protein
MTYRFGAQRSYQRVSARESSPLRLRTCQPRFAALPAGIALLAVWLSTPAYPQDATWAGPGNSWNPSTPGNWSPQAAPSNMATFSGASPTNIVISGNPAINTIMFTAGAPAYSFTIQSPSNFSISGSGIINNSANPPSFSIETGASLFFMNSSTAANAVLTDNGILGFFNTSTAGTATITINSGGLTNFLDTSSAGQANITVNSGGSLGFRNNSTAANATIVNNGEMLFIDSSTAGNAKVTTNNGGDTAFQVNSSGGQAQFITNAGGKFDISGLTNGGMTAGSIAGAGSYVLGTNTLTVGGNDLSTEVDGVITGSGGSLVKVGAGALTLTNANTYAGPTIISQGAINLTGSLLSPVTVQGAGTLGSTGTVFNTVTNAGTVEPGFGLAEGQFGALTVKNYVGEGGTLALRTYLGADGSPSDRLIINGGAADSSFVRVTNAGGPGAETTSNGILVVQTINGGATAPGAFVLAGEARAGDYDYDLFRGGVGGSDPQDWFLRSTFIVGPLPPGPEEPTDPTLPPTPPPEPLPPGVYPIIGPELATYGVLQPIARQLGATTLGTLHDRIGDTLTNTAGPCATSPGNTIVRKSYDTRPQSGGCEVYGWWPSAWGRVFGQGIDNRYSAFADPSASGQVLGFQVGLDVWRGSSAPGHSDTAGFYAAYANGNDDVTGLVTNRAATAYVLQHTGADNLNAVSGGLYWTHYGPGGWYLDAVAQGTSYSGTGSTQFASLGATGYGFIASLEGGYPFPLPSFGPGFVLEPEAQVLWQAVWFRQAHDGFGPVSLGSTFGPSGRLGLRAKWEIVADNGFVWQPYLRAGFWDDWGGNATTDLGGDAAPLLEADRRVVLGGGLTTKANANLSFYGNADYQFAVSDIGGGKRNGFGGTAGLRYTW